jgi:hypothetical protein
MDIVVVIIVVMAFCYVSSIAYFLRCRSLSLILTLTLTCGSEYIGIIIFHISNACIMSYFPIQTVLIVYCEVLRHLPFFVVLLWVLLTQMSFTMNSLL